MDVVFESKARLNLFFGWAAQLLFGNNVKCSFWQGIFLGYSV